MNDESVLPEKKKKKRMFDKEQTKQIWGGQNFISLPPIKPNV